MVGARFFTEGSRLRLAGKKEVKLNENIEESGILVTGSRPKQRIRRGTGRANTQRPRISCSQS